MKNAMGTRILELLKERDMTQRELANRVNISEVQLSRYISGDRDPKPNVIANMATALHTTSDYLLGIEEKFNYTKVKRMIARNASEMTAEERTALINALFGGE